MKYLPLTLLLALAGCSDTHYKKLSYVEATTLPGYGYITLDFRQGKELGYGKFQFYGVFNTPDKTDYMIMYTKKGKSLYVSVENAPFKGKVLNAFIPRYDGYVFRSVSRELFLEPCKSCTNRPRNFTLDVYSVQALGGVECAEAEHKNEQMFSYNEVCPGDTWDKRGAVRLKDILGDVFVTPHFHDEVEITFTHRAPLTD